MNINKIENSSDIENRVRSKSEAMRLLVLFSGTLSAETLASLIFIQRTSNSPRVGYLLRFVNTDGTCTLN